MAGDCTTAGPDAIYERAIDPFGTGSLDARAIMSDNRRRSGQGI